MVHDRKKRMCMCSQNNLDKFARKLYKNTSPMKWKYFLHRRHAFTPNDFQMHQQLLDHSYCKRENSLTKFNNSENVMILVVRLASSERYVFVSEKTFFLRVHSKSRSGGKINLMRSFESCREKVISSQLLKLDGMNLNEFLSLLLSPFWRKRTAPVLTLPNRFAIIFFLLLLVVCGWIRHAMSI
jgi:hypothetical protein